MFNLILICLASCLERYLIFVHLGQYIARNKSLYLGKLDIIVDPLHIIHFYISQLVCQPPLREPLPTIPKSTLIFLYCSPAMKHL